MSDVREPVLTGVTLWPRDVGPYAWHDFDAERMRHDLRGIAASGLRAVRTLLPWDVFMPAMSRPDHGALRNFETFVEAAARVELVTVPVLFAQTIGDCVFLPPYAIDVAASRPGVRAVLGGVVQPGGPRDQYTDSRMLEAQLRWLEGMLGAFAGNPAVAMWDLGHDPATVMRPRRIEHLRAWTALLAARVHDAGERCALTLGAGDVTSARGVRLSAAAASVDILGLAVDTKHVAFAGSGVDAAATAFLVQLSMRLAGDTTPLHVQITAPAGDVGAAESAIDSVRRYAGDAVDRTLAVGSAGVHAAAWSDNSDRAAQLPPFDRWPELLRGGVVDAAGTPTLFGAAWLQAAGEAGDARPRRPWPTAIDVADYYANLPHSADDLYAEWRRLGDE